MGSQRASSVLASFAFALIACSPDASAPEADVLGMDYDTGEDEVSESESDTGPKAECVPPPEAIGVGDCWEEIHGYKWTADSCEAIRGCSCEGEGCAELYATASDCNHAYRDCDHCQACTVDQACVITCGHIVGDFYDILCRDRCEGCSICPEGYGGIGGCELLEPISELPYYECQDGGGG